MSVRHEGSEKKQQMNSFRKLRRIKREHEWFNNNWRRLACIIMQAFFLHFLFVFVLFYYHYYYELVAFYSHLYFCVLFRFICHLENKTEKTHNTSIKCGKMEKHMHRINVWDIPSLSLVLFLHMNGFYFAMLLNCLLHFFYFSFLLFFSVSSIE